MLHDFQQQQKNLQYIPTFFSLFPIATPSFNDPEGEDVYEDYESSTELQTVNQTNGTGLLKSNQVSIKNLKVIHKPLQWPFLFDVIQVTLCESPEI